MTTSKESSERESAEVHELRQRLQEALNEIERLKSELIQATSKTISQREDLRALNEFRAADVAAMNASNITIKNQADELDMARHALLLQAELEAANKELETFSYSVSHDLRSPLRAINGFAKALIEDYGSSLPPEAMRYLTHIENGAIRMGALIDDLLSFSRLSRLELTATVVDMQSLLNLVWSDLLREEPERKVELHCASKLPTIQADRALMRQVLVNLLSNALKFTSRSTSPVVEVSFTESDSETTFAFQDNGVGFDPRYAAKLFGPFQRLHKTKDFPGTGIGLALVQRIINRHGGRAWAESELDQGACFYFSIPKQGGAHLGRD